MVDYVPFSGDYRNTRVHKNRFTADGNAFKIAIAVGPAIWGDDIDNVGLLLIKYSCYYRRTR